MSGAITVRDDGQLWVRADLDERWAFEYRMELQDGQAVVAELRVHPRASGVAPRGGLTTRLLRTLKLGQHTRRVTRQIEAMAAGPGPVIEQHPAAPGRSASVSASFGGPALDRQMIVEETGFAEIQPPTSRGRPARPDAFYAELAADYVAAMDGGSRSPTADVAGRRGYSAPHVRDAIHKARRLGLLTAPVAKGKPGGKLTERALELLANSKP